jgi:hypothetical protein
MARSQTDFAQSRYTRTHPAPVQDVGIEGGRREQIGAALDHLAPGIPRFEREAIIDHALDSPGLGVADPGNAAWLSMVAYIRHVFTDYDALLAEGFDQDAARFFVIDEINEYLADWGARRRVDGDG